MGKRWANDVAAGMLVAALGALGLAVYFWFGLPLLPIAMGCVSVGAAISLFGAFEYFASHRERVSPHGGAPRS